MQYLLDLFLNGNLNQPLNEDFLKKRKDERYAETIASNPNQYSLKMILEQLLATNKIERLKNEIDSIDEKVLYNSFIHGINHNERVLFWTYFLCLQCGIDEVGTRIVLDGAKYHDVGRVNDLVDDSHGARSANEIEKIVTDSIYKDLANISLLKAIVELHSLKDKDAEKIMKKYGTYERRKI